MMVMALIFMLVGQMNIWFYPVFMYCRPVVHGPDLYSGGAYNHGPGLYAGGAYDHGLDLYAGLAYDHMILLTCMQVGQMII